MTVDDLAQVIMGAADAKSVAPMAQMRYGVVTQVSPLLVQVGGATARPCSNIAGYIPVLNDFVVVLVRDADRVAIGSIGGATAPVVRCRRAANQVIATATATDISWDTEDADVFGFIAVTATTFTVPANCAGQYLITSRLASSAAVGAYRIFCNINVTSTITGVTANYRVPFYDESDAAAAINIPLAVGDTFKFTFFQASGGNTNLTAWMQAIRIGL